MKKFIYKVSFFLAICFLVTVCFPMILDPYNVFHPRNIRDNGVEPNRHYIKMIHVVEHPDKFDGLLFGSSRVGAVHVDRIPSGKVYNMAYSSGIPGEFLEDLRTLVEQGIVPEKVYVGIDEQSYMDRPENRYDDMIRVPYQYARKHPLKFRMLYFDSAKTFRSIPTIWKHQPTENFSEIFYEYGWIQDYDWSLMSHDEYVRLDLDPSIYTQQDVDLAVEDMRQIKELCDANGIELIVFTNPSLWMWYDIGVESGYLSFLREIVKFTDFYNFSGRNDITLNKENYSDPGHYSAQAGDMMIDCMEKGIVDEELLKQGFGAYVTPDNIEDVILQMGMSEPD